VGRESNAPGTGLGNRQRNHATAPGPGGGRQRRCAGQGCCVQRVAAGDGRNTWLTC
jgi:hypothetical protein